MRTFALALLLLPPAIADSAPAPARKAEKKEVAFGPGKWIMHWNGGLWEFHVHESGACDCYYLAGVATWRGSWAYDAPSRKLALADARVLEDGSHADVVLWHVTLDADMAGEAMFSGDSIKFKLEKAK